MGDRDDELKRDVLRVLRRAGVRGRPLKKRPSYIGSVDGPSDFSSNMEKYEHEATDHAYDDAFGRTRKRPKA